MLIKDYLQPYKTCSDYELSKKTGISATQIANIFNHGSSTKLENFVKICHALQVPSEKIQEWYELTKPVDAFQIANQKLNELLK
jgi:hypothetical protein